MSKLIYNITDDKFSSQHSSYYQLSMLISTSSVSYFINDTQRNLLVLKHYSFNDYGMTLSVIVEEIESILKSDTHLGLDFQLVRVAFWSSYFTFIPNTLYDEGNKEIYLKNVGLYVKNNWEIRKDRIEAIEGYNIYAVQHEVFKIIQKALPGGLFYHNLTALILGCRRESTRSSSVEKRVYVNLRDQTMQILYFDNANFQFANQFSYNTAEDVVYYVMLTYHQHKLSPEQVPLYVSGAVLQNSEVYSLLYRFIKEVHFLQSLGYHNRSARFDSVAEHLYFDLFSLSVC